LQISDAQFLEAKRVFEGEWGSKAPSIPEIRVSYDKDSLRKFYVKKGEKQEILGDTIRVVIMKSRNQYSLYADEKEDRLSTDEFDSFKENVTLRKGGEIIMTKPYPEVKAYIKATHPTMKFINVLYVYILNSGEEGGKLHKLYIKPASRQNLWDYQASTGMKASFSFSTELGTSEGKKGSTVFYPITFKKAEDMDEKTFKSFMLARMALDSELKAQEETQARAVPADAIEGEAVPMTDEEGKEFLESL
jgi:hypothetical protein